MAEVSVDHVTTSMEIVDSTANSPDLQKLRAELRQFLATEMTERAMREHDDCIHDRSWRSDVKPG